MSSSQFGAGELAEPIIAILEDDTDLREELAFGLERLGFRVWSATSAAEFFQELPRRSCHVAIVDVGLPEIDGFSVAARLRSISSVGIVMLTARGHIEDRVRGLQGGADAYMVKPADLRELSAVLLGVLRRLYPAQPQSIEKPSAPPAQRNSWSLNTNERLLVGPDSRHSLRLTQSEYAFMTLVLQRQGMVVSRMEAARAISHNVTPDYDLHRIDMLVSRLRRKAEEAGMELPLRAVRGKGYLFGQVS